MCSRFLFSLGLFDLEVQFALIIFHGDPFRDQSSQEVDSVFLMRVFAGLFVELNGEKRRLFLILHLLDGLGYELLLGEFAVGLNFRKLLSSP